MSSKTWRAITHTEYTLRLAVPKRDYRGMDKIVCTVISMT